MNVFKGQQLVAALVVTVEGASTGGRHGYKLAQKYPGDYDGIIATLPTIYFNRWATNNFYRNIVVERDLGGAPLTEGQQDLVSNAAINACDVMGGEHPGDIMDNAACHYDPTQDPKILCPPAPATTPWPYSGALVSRARATPGRAFIRSIQSSRRGQFARLPIAGNMLCSALPQ